MSNYVRIKHYEKTIVIDESDLEATSRTLSRINPRALAFMNESAENMIVRLVKEAIDGGHSMIGTAGLTILIHEGVDGEVYPEFLFSADLVNTFVESAL